MIREHVALTQRAGRLDRRRRAIRDRRAAPAEPACACGSATTTPPRRWIERANATGRALFTRTVLDGRPVLRFSIGARTTQWRHVEAAWELLQRSLTPV